VTDDVVRHPPVWRDLVTLAVYWLAVVSLAILAVSLPVSVRAGEPLTLSGPTTVVQGEVAQFTVYGGVQDRDIFLFADRAQGVCLFEIPEFLSDGAQLSLVVPEPLDVADTIGAFAEVYWDTSTFALGTFYLQAGMLGGYDTRLSNVLEVEVVSPEVYWMAFDLAYLHWCGVTDRGDVRCGAAPGSVVLEPPAFTDATQVAVGTNAACAIVGPESQIECWQRGQAAIVSNRPTGGGWAMIDAYDAHFCATHVDGSAKCWGNITLERTRVPAGQTWLGVLAGGAHSCGLTTAGVARCWGYNAYNQRSVPVGNWLQLAVGDYHSVFGDGSTIATSGYDQFRETFRNVRQQAPYFQLATSDSLGCAVRSADGAPECWGRLPIVLDDGLAVTLPQGVKSVAVPLQLESLSSGSGDMLCGIDGGDVRCFGTASDWVRWGDALPTPFQN
jgi:hypothetical protein